MRKIKDYSNQIIVNNYGLEVHILSLHEKRKRATYWNYICPYCGNDKAINDISKIKSAKTCDKCIDNYVSKTTKRKNYNKQKPVISRDYSKSFYANFNNDKIELLTQYINAKTKISCRCKIDGYEWDTKPSVLLRGGGCPKCAGNLPKTTYSFIKEVNDLWHGEYEVIGEYINRKTKIKIKHNSCNNIFEMTPENFINANQRCPICNQSKGEMKCLKYFKNNNIKYISQKSFPNLLGIGGKLLSYDFYLLDYNLLIEYQGEFHDGKANWYVAENLEKQQEHDRRKRQYAKDHNIKLLEIWYWDYENIEEILSRELGLSA